MIDPMAQCHHFKPGDASSEHILHQRFHNRTQQILTRMHTLPLKRVYEGFATSASVSVYAAYILLWIHQ